MTEVESFSEWCIVEQMCHRKLAGQVTEVTLDGVLSTSRTIQITSSLLGADPPGNPPPQPVPPPARTWEGWAVLRDTLDITNERDRAAVIDILARLDADLRLDKIPKQVPGTPQGLRISKCLSGKE